MICIYQKNVLILHRITELVCVVRSSVRHARINNIINFLKPRDV